MKKKKKKKKKIILGARYSDPVLRMQTKNRWEKKDDVIRIDQNPVYAMHYAWSETSLSRSPWNCLLSWQHTGSGKITLN